MTARDAKKWACDQAAAWLQAAMESGGVTDDDDPDSKRKEAALAELIRELERRGR